MIIILTPKKVNVQLEQEPETKEQEEVEEEEAEEIEEEELDYLYLAFRDYTRVIRVKKGSYNLFQGCVDPAHFTARTSDGEKITGTVPSVVSPMELDVP